MRISSHSQAHFAQEDDERGTLLSYPVDPAQEREAPFTTDNLRGRFPHAPVATPGGYRMPFRATPQAGPAC